MRMKRKRKRKKETLVVHPVSPQCSTENLVTNIACITMSAPQQRTVNVVEDIGEFYIYREEDQRDLHAVRKNECTVKIIAISVIR